MDKLKSLKNDLLQIANSNSNDKSREITDCLMRHIQIYGVTNTITKTHLFYLKDDKESYLNHQNRAATIKMAEAALLNGNIEIIEEDPENYRDENYKLPEWEQYAEKRTLRMLVLK